jgi:glycosyltransferase involved in cell wall biosynthesis
VTGRVLVICPHPERRAPGQRLKFEQYYPSWRSAGLEVDVRPFWSERTWEILYRPGHRLRKAAGLLDGYRRRLRDLRDAKRADLVYLFLHAAPVGPPVIERLIDRAGVPIVYDIDDLVYLPHSSSQNRFMRFFRSQSKIFELMRRSRHVIVCTEYLGEVARRENPNVTNISSTIDTDAYAPRPHRATTDGVVLGWTGSHSTSPYLHILDDVLRELHETEGARVKVIGDGGFSIPGLGVEALPWRLETEVADLSTIDIGMYPLPDEEWVLGKSGLKALQYMALGIPTVAQRVGANLAIIEHGVNGLLAGSAEEWLSCVRTLIQDPDLRKRLGDAGRQTVLQRYSVRVNAPRYLAILEAAALKTSAESSPDRA